MITVADQIQLISDEKCPKEVCEKIAGHFMPDRLHNRFVAVNHKAVRKFFERVEEAREWANS